MLNLTKMYLYRILHSTVALVCMLLLVGLTAFGLTVSCLMTRMVPDPETTAVMEEAEEEPEETILDEYMGVIQNGFPIMFFGIFAAVFYNGDEKHGYIKNIVTQYKYRHAVLLPRLLSLAVYTAAVSLLNLLVMAIMLSCFYPGIGWGFRAETLGYIGLHFLLLMAFLFIVQFLTTLNRGTAIPVCFSVFASMNAAALVALPLNFLAYKLLNIRDAAIERFFLDTYLFDIRSAENVWSLFALFGCYAVGTALLSCLLLNKRDVR